MSAANKALAAAERDPDFFPINKLPNNLLASVFAAAAGWDPAWARHTIPLVCKAWNELYEASPPLHERLEVDFEHEAERVARAAAREGRALRRDPVADPSRVLSWARRHARSVRTLHVDGGGWGRNGEALLARVVAAVGPFVTDVFVDVGELCRGPSFWESLRDFVVPAGRLRSFGVGDCVDFGSSGPGLEALAQLAGSLEELMLPIEDESLLGPGAGGLPRFPESFCALKKLRRLILPGHPRIKAIPARISSLKKLEELDLGSCGLSSLPKELGKLSRLWKLDVSGNKKLGRTLPAGEAFPAELAGMKSLRELSLDGCRLGTVPAFVGGLKSLEGLDLRDNHLTSLPKELGELSRLTELYLSDNKTLGKTLPAAAAFPAELAGMTSLRGLGLHRAGLRTVPAFIAQLKSLESLTLCCNHFPWVPKELGELSALTKLVLAGNNLKDAAAALPTELGNMKSLRELYLESCGLRTFPAAFVGALAEPLELLDLRFNVFEVDAAALAALLRHCGPRLREVRLSRSLLQPRGFGSPWNAESLANLEAFKARLLAENPDAKVTFEYKEDYDPSA